VAYKNRRKAKIAVKSATLRHDVLSIAREASAAPAATSKRATRKLDHNPPRWSVNFPLADHLGL